MRHTMIIRARRLAKRIVVLLLGVVILSSCSSWRGIANVPLPVGPGSDPDHLTVYVQVPNVLSLTVNSRVRVADVYVGSVRAIELRNWIPTLTVSLQPDVKLPVNTLARIGQTSLLGTQHLQLDSPADPAPQRLRSGDTIPLKNSSAFPTVERTLASISVVLRGGGISNLEAIQTEVNNVVDGRADQIRDFLGRMDRFTDELNQQRGAITRAIDSTNRLLSIAAGQNQVIDQALTELPPLVKHFSDKQKLFSDAVQAVGRFSAVVDQMASDSRSNFDANLKLLQRPLAQLSRAAPQLIQSLRVILTQPYEMDSIFKSVRGDYQNISLVEDLTLSSMDNALLTGTGFSGSLRALEQAWGRDPATMIPDIRYVPNPADAPVERGE